MPHSRRQPRIAPTERVTLRLTTEQRDWFMAASATPRNLGHALHRAPVREGKLAIRVDRAELDALIMAAATVDAHDRREEKLLRALLSYLEEMEDRFEEPFDEETEVEGEAAERS